MKYTSSTFEGYWKSINLWAIILKTFNMIDSKFNCLNVWFVLNWELYAFTNIIMVQPAQSDTLILQV